jgi:hypothetical protein
VKYYMIYLVKIFIICSELNMGVAIIDFRVCPPLVKCQNLMFSGFIDTLMYGFSSTGVTIYCYFGLKFNDNTWWVYSLYILIYSWTLEQISSAENVLHLYIESKTYIYIYTSLIEYLKKRHTPCTFFNITYVHLHRS